LSKKRAKKPAAKKDAAKSKLKLPDLSAYDQGGSPSLGQSRVSAIADQIGRTWGKSTAMPLDVAPVARVKTLPFGILMLDWLTWGGLRLGAINRLWGPKSVLKSTLCLRALRSAQNYCRHCVVGDTMVQGRVLGVQRMWYVGEVVKVTTEGGRSLVLTPNHRVVAEHAFVRAGDLKEGQYLLGYSGQQDSAALGLRVDEHHEHHEPARIEDVFRSLAEQFGTTTHRVSADDLHGDAAFGDGEVEVVAADSVLSLGEYSEKFEGVREPVLVVDGIRRAASDLSEVMRARGLGDLPIGPLAAPHGFPRLTALPIDDLGVVVAAAGTRPLELGRFGAASYRDAPFLEPETYDLFRHAEFAGELVHWGSGDVAPDKIVNVERHPFSGHVYDLHTKSGWMVAEDLVISNCKTPLVWHPECTCRDSARQKRSGMDFDDEPCPVQVRRGAGEDIRCVDCRCPSPRFWLLNEDDYAWLPPSSALRISEGALPEGNVLRKADHPTLGRTTLPALVCDPPPHLVGKQGVKPKDVVFAPARRCEPMRCLYLDSEGTIDEKWARENGVDTSNVLLVGSGWAEKSLSTIEEAVVAQEFDLIVIDSISMLNTQSNQEKALDEAPVVASHANVMGRFITRHIAQCFEEGLTARYRPTVLLTSQVTTKNIGWGKHPYLGPTGGNKLEHSCCLDLRLMAKGYTYDASNTYAIHGDFEFEVSKHKYGGSPGASGIIRYWLRPDDNHDVGDSDDLDVVMRYARGLGDGFILEGGGKQRLTLYSDFLEGGEMAFAKVGDCAAFLRAHSSIYDDLRNRVLQSLWDQGAALKV